MKNENTFICDCCKSEAFGLLSMHFWYGSKHDMKQGSVHACDVCADKIIKYIKDTFHIEKFLTNIEEF